MSSTRGSCDSKRNKVNLIDVQTTLLLLYSTRITFEIRKLIFKTVSFFRCKKPNNVESDLETLVAFDSFIVGDTVPCRQKMNIGSNQNQDLMYNGETVNYYRINYCITPKV